MKRAALALLILTIIAFICWFTDLRLLDASEALESRVDLLEQSVLNENPEQSHALMAALSDEWRRRTPIYLLLAGRKHAGHLDVVLARAQRCLQQNSSSDLLGELSELKAYLILARESHTSGMYNLL